MEITGYDILDTTGNSVLPESVKANALLSVATSEGREVAMGKFDGQGNLIWTPPDFKLPLNTPITVTFHRHITFRKSD